MDNLQEIRTYATTLGLVHTKNELEKLIHSAEAEEESYNYWRVNSNSNISWAFYGYI